MSTETMTHTVTGDTAEPLTIPALPAVVMEVHVYSAAEKNSSSLPNGMRSVPVVEVDVACARDHEQFARTGGKWMMTVLLVDPLTRQPGHQYLTDGTLDNAIVEVSNGRQRSHDVQTSPSGDLPRSAPDGPRTGNPGGPM
ncbi:hypothetical protein [Arthrobacter sp. ISL-28]|uniref:hypothetical protein n=1 Tax=Arthrobacter sp. ISL-28 TaxID=2819108 RepID=UPI001BE599E6|nr:hypothetical protein [Arthrobacter sp. ISL-28]MBT2523840.1 hypothetical protein [Arthrobacter sp. ISL-28]